MGANRFEGANLPVTLAAMKAFSATCKNPLVAHLEATLREEYGRQIGKVSSWDHGKSPGWKPLLKETAYVFAPCTLAAAVKSNRMPALVIPTVP